MGFRGNHANKRDYNEPEIVNALRKLGYSVERMDIPADLLVGKGGRCWLIEVKAEGKTLNAKQRKWADTWRGGLMIFRSVADVLEWHEERQ